MKLLPSLLLALAIPPAAACKSHAHIAKPADTTVRIELTGLR